MLHQVLSPIFSLTTAEDDRMKVWVSELNDLGNLNGMVGQDASLKCHAECMLDSLNGYVIYLL